MDTHGARKRIASPAAIVVLALAALGGCETEMAIMVSSGLHADGSRELGSRYAWGLPEDGHTVADTLVQREIGFYLRRRGFEPAASGEPDFVVAAGVVGSDAGELEPGSIVLDILDPASGRRRWRGLAEGTVRERDPPAVREERISRAARLIVARMPRPG